MPLAPPPSFHLNLESVRTLALEAGFTDAGLVGLPYDGETQDAAHFAEWVQAGRAGAMHYLERRTESGELVRGRVKAPFPWAQSAIVCFADYHADAPRSTDATLPGTGWIARYAWSSRLDISQQNQSKNSAAQTVINGVRRPSDYHKVLLKRIKALEARLRKTLPADNSGEIEMRGYVDTGPVVERALARAAGLGWAGKNTCLIHPQLGSYGFLAVLLTSLGVQGERTPPAPDRCGNCRRCLDACPTGALIAPHQMDARRCISYLTIEHRGAIEAELMEKMGRQIFGCDICQDVCPWNHKPPAATDPELEARAELVNPALEDLAALDESEFERRFNGSPVRRAGFLGLRRNLAIAMGNSGNERFAARLEQWTEATDDGLKCAALWALNKLRGN